MDVMSQARDVQAVAPQLDEDALFAPRAFAEFFRCVDEKRLRAPASDRRKARHRQSMPSFFSLYRSARKVMPSAAAVRVLL